jgi:uncharacterized protein (DUF2384 family)
MSAALVQPDLVQPELTEPKPLEREWLGLEEIPPGADVLAMVERRFEPAIIDRLLGLGFERAEVHSVVLPARTLQHRRSRKELLTLEESDRVIRLLRVLRATEVVYGTRRCGMCYLHRVGGRRFRC